MSYLRRRLPVLIAVRAASEHAGCAPPGIDCLERSGGQMEDVFMPNSGKDVPYVLRRVA